MPLQLASAIPRSSGGRTTERPPPARHVASASAPLPPAAPHLRPRARVAKPAPALLAEQHLQPRLPRRKRRRQPDPPTVLAYRDLQHERRGTRASSDVRDTALLLAGYLAVWAAAGLLAYALLEAGRALDGGLFAWDRAGRWAATGVLVAAALYQLTPSKRACLPCSPSPAAQLSQIRNIRT
jgi:hypothetical protein